MLIFYSAREISIPGSDICSRATPTFQFGRNYVHLMIARINNTRWRNGDVSVCVTCRARSLGSQRHLLDAVHAFDLLDKLINLRLENSATERPALVFFVSGFGDRPQKSVERIDDCL